MSLGDVLSTRARFESDRGARGVRAIRALVFRGGVQGEVAGFFSALRGGEEQRSLHPREDILREESRRQNLNCT